MGFFQKIIDGLKKTKERIGFKLNEIFKRGIFDEDFYEELEFILLSADVGPTYHCLVISPISP